jgi:hypothetical protein
VKFIKRADDRVTVSIIPLAAAPVAMAAE